MNADLLVSIHNNSAETSAPNGVEVLYYDKVGLKPTALPARSGCFHSKGTGAENRIAGQGIISALI